MLGILLHGSHINRIFFLTLIRYMQINNGERSVILKGLNLRLLADAPVSDLVAKSSVEVANYEREDNKMIYQRLHKLTCQRKVRSRRSKGIFRDSRTGVADRW